MIHTVMCRLIATSEMNAHSSKIDMYMP